MIIDCKECEMFRSEHCSDCFVMAVLSRKKESTVTLDDTEAQAVGALQEAGLAPVLRFKQKAG